MIERMDPKKALSVLNKITLDRLSLHEVEALSLAIKVLGEKQSMWKSPDEELPRAYRDVLVITRTGKVLVAYYSPDGSAVEGPCWVVGRDSISTKTVLTNPPDYWMEIPEVPE